MRTVYQLRRVYQLYATSLRVALSLTLICIQFEGVLFADAVIVVVVVVAVARACVCVCFVVVGVLDATCVVAVVVALMLILLWSSLWCLLLL